jgi:hypothetical protein
MLPHPTDIAYPDLGQKERADRAVFLSGELRAMLTGIRAAIEEGRR